MMVIAVNITRNTQDSCDVSMTSNEKHISHTLRYHNEN